MIKLNTFFQQIPTYEKSLKNTDFILSKFVKKDFPLYVSMYRSGLSCQIHKDLGNVVIYSDKGVNITRYLPNIVKSIQSIKCEKAILCATLTLNEANKTGKEVAEYFKTVNKDNNIFCHIEDILYLNDDTSDFSFSVRKEKLDTIGIKQSSFLIADRKDCLNISPQIVCKNTIELERAVSRINLFKDFNGVKIQIDMPYDLEDNECGSYIYSKNMPDTIKSFSKSCSQQLDETAIYCGFLSCEVKDVYILTTGISNVRAGNVLNAIEKMTEKFTLVETRNFSGREIPPMYKSIQLKKDLSKTFLTEGTRFYYDDSKNLPLIIQLYPTWGGYQANFITHIKANEFNKALNKQINIYAEENNFLKGEKFSVAGEFLDEQTITLEDLKLTAPVKDKIKKLSSLIAKNDPTLDSRGLIFIGPPGCGKTLTGKLLSKAASTFIWVTAKDFSNMGTSYAMTTAFDLARDLRPSILFMEDIDSYIEYGMIDLLKTELDGMKLNNGVFTILTSNFPENLPEAIIDRPGRFHDIIYFALPSKDIRKEMLLHFLKEDIDAQTLETVLKQTESFSGAHIREVCRFAEIIRKEDNRTLSQSLIQSLEKLIEQRKLINEFKNKNKLLGGEDR